MKTKFSSSIAVLLLLLPFFCRGEVIFVPGWLTEYQPGIFPTVRIKAIYPDENVTFMRWDANASWEKAKRNAAGFVPELVAEIEKMSPAEQAKLTLIGHSLGGRIVALCAAELEKKKIKVRRIILLGAAIDCDAGELASCGRVSSLPALNLFNRNDMVLSEAYANAEQIYAAGHSGIFYKIPNMKEYRVYCALPLTMSKSSIIKHISTLYLVDLQLIKEGKIKEYIPDITTYTDKFTPSPEPLPESAGKAPLYHAARLDRFGDWLLLKADGGKDAEDQQQEFFLIVDPFGRIRWSRDFAEIYHKFSEIKKAAEKRIYNLPKPE